MKKTAFLFFLFTFAALIGCSGSDPKGKAKLKGSVVNIPLRADGSVDSSKIPLMDFQTTVHNFGTLKEGTQAEYSFHFINTGKVDLIISDAHASCGCTVASYPKDPVPPGSSGSIDVKYDSKGRNGTFNKGVTVAANTFPSETVLTIKGTVK